MQNRHTGPTRIRWLLATGVAFSLGLHGTLYGQTDDDDEVFELSPFEVTSTDAEGYRATSTLAGTRIRTDLRDVGTAISVYTEEFLADIGATDSGSLLQYTTNAEVAGMQGTYAGLGNGTTLDETDSLRNPSTQNRIRGLTAADNTRDYFVTDIPWDSYNVNRVDIQRGPNSFIFGLGSPAGIVNATLADASMQNDGNAELRFGSYGSFRTSVSLNKVLVEDTLSVRVAALMDKTKFNQDPAFEDDERIYLALRWEPKVGSDSMKTTFRGKFENGNVDANRPRAVTPVDSISAWFRPTEVSASNPYGGMGKYAAVYGYGLGTNYPTEVNPYLNSVVNQQQPFYQIDGATGQILDARAGYFNPGARNPDGSTRGAGQGIAGKAYAEQMFNVRNLPDAANNLGLPFASSGQYRSQSLRDPSIFDFNNNLIDGRSKSEFEDWDAINFDFSQTWFHDRLGLQLSYDDQDYSRGGESFLGNSPEISVDVTQFYQDTTPNPHFGRPFVRSNAGGTGNAYESRRTYERASLFAELRADDFLESDSVLAKILGKHRFNAVYSTENYKTETRSWQRHATSQEWDDAWTGVANTSESIRSRPPVAMVYLGPSLAGASSAAGARLPGVGNADLANSNPQIFDSRWNAPGVAFDAPWTVPAELQTLYPLDGFPTDNGQTQWLQNSNPANYVGWGRNTPLNLWSYNGGADPRLITDMQLSQRETKSYAATWQGYLWNNAIVATLGWREDEVSGRATVAGNISGVPRTPLDLDIDLPPTYEPPSGSVFKDTSTSSSLVVHLNQLFDNDPLPLNVSLSYSESSNFQVTDTRRDIFGTPISNPTGDSEDIGILLSTKDGKYSFRAIKYESEVASASSQLSNSGGIGSVIQQGLRFRNVYTYKLGGYDWGTRDQPQGRNLAANAYPLDGDGPYFVGEGSPEELALEDAWVSQWNAIQADLTANGFLEAWGMTGLQPLDELALPSEYAANPAAASPSNPASVYLLTARQPSGFTVTADTLSKGYEFEFVANPTENWRIAINASKTEATRNNVGGELLDQFVAYLDEKLIGTEAGNMPQFGNPGLSIYNNSYSPWRGNYVQMKLAEGTAVPELREWRYNVITNYSFTDGLLKNVGVGGSYRWQDEVGIGYPIDPNAAESTFVIDRPIYGPSEDSIDLWASYSRPLSDKIDWRIQLNIRNAFADDELIPISVQPSAPGQTADFASVRIAPIQEWFITNTFSF